MQKITPFLWFGPRTEEEQAHDSRGGFALALARAKAFLDHDIQLNPVPDRFPDRVVKH